MAGEFVLSAFGDEIAPDLAEQIAGLRREEIRYIEFRAAWGKNVLALNDEEVHQARDLLQEHGIGVSAVGSPIGKVAISENFEEHLALFRRALWVTRQFDASFVRVFSFFMPPAEAARHRDEVLRRMSTLAAEARATGITLLHENEKDIYGDTPERCRDLVESTGSPALRVTFDPANFVQVGVRPFDQAYPLLRDHIAYWHIKDALLADGSVRVAGDGDGQIGELLQAETTRGYHGFASLEPHLKSGGRYAGFSGPELFHEAAAACKRLVRGVEDAAIG